MPVEFTQQEKDEIIAKHTALIDEFNAFLPNEQKLKYDENLINRLNDENEVKYYKTLNEAKEKMTRQKQIYDELEARFGPAQAGKNFMNRSIHFGFKVEDTTEAREYNEKLYQKYQKDPDTVLYQRYKKVLDFNPQEIMKIADDKVKLAEFYLNNQRLCEDAFVVNSVLDNPDAKINPTLKASLKNMANDIEGVTFPVNNIKKEMGESYFTFPQYMTPEQAAILIAVNPKYMEKNAPLRGCFDNAINQNEASANPKETIDIFKKSGLIIGKGFFKRYKATIHDPETNTTKEVSLEEGLKRREEGNVTISERPKEEKREINKINNAYYVQYQNVFKDRFSKNFDNQAFDLNRIKLAHQGNWVERFLRKTSPEYKAFIKQFEAYNDPTSKDYLNKDKLRNTAQAYYDHKAEQGISLSNMDATGRGRLKLVSAVIKTIDQMEANEKDVDNDISDRLREEDDIVREQFLNENEVVDNEFSSIEVDDELNLTVDNELDNRM